MCPDCPHESESPSLKRSPPAACLPAPCWHAGARVGPPRTAAGDGVLAHKTFLSPPQLGSPQQKPKRLRLVVDVSGSMYRFNGVDGRLERSMEAVCMVMEAFENYEEKFKVTAGATANERPIRPRVGPELGREGGEVDAGSRQLLHRHREREPLVSSALTTGKW